MGSKKIILSSKQLQEITGQINEIEGLYLGQGNYSTADALGISADEKNDDTLENGEAFDNMTTDRFADTVNYSGSLNRLCIRCSKSEWEKRNLIKEESEHGNSDINQRSNFGADGQQGDTGVSYDAAKQKRYRLNTWEKKLKNGTPEEKKAAVGKVQQLKSDPDVMKQINDLNTAEKNSESLRNGKKAAGMNILNVSGREANNGKRHGQKNEPIISYFDADGNTIK